MTKELEKKIKCEACNKTFPMSEVLRAANPFCPEKEISGCPHCRETEQMVGACQHDGCDRQAGLGAPNVAGFQYVVSCGVHSCLDGKFIEADKRLKVW